MATKILEYDMDAPPDTEDFAWPAYARLMVVFKRGTQVLGAERFPLTNGRIDRPAIAAAARVIQARAARHGRTRTDSVPANRQEPRVSVVICTRDRAEHLDRCLQALLQCDPAPYEIIVVDNASATDCTADVAGRHGVRCVPEPRPGLNWARSRGVLAATGDVVAYIDDDVTVTPAWLRPLAASFQDMSLAGVTGLVLPYSLDDPASEMFEEYCGFIRGFEPRTYSLSTFSPMAAANVGAGACMAFRREILNELRLFEVELDAGTAARTGGDTYAFYRLISLGYRIDYNPDVVVRHRHRDNEEAVVSTLRDYSIGTYVVYLHCFFRHREPHAAVAGMRWFWSHHLRHLGRGLLRRPGAQPLRLTLAEIRGCFVAPFAFLRSLRDNRAAIRALSAPVVREAGR